MTIQFSNIVNNIKDSATLSIMAEASNMRNQGLDVISLSVGESDFDTPENVKQAAIKAIMAGKTKYTAVDGVMELKEAIVEKFRRENNLDYQTTQISVGAGAKQIIFNALLATLNPGDEVIIPAPYWVSYPEMVTFAQGIPIVVASQSTDNFKLKPEYLEAAITDKTKWLILNSPSNPTGAAYNADELRQLAAVLLKYPHVHVLSDDIYEHIVFDGFKFHTLAEIEPALFDRVMTVNGVSKSHAMTGWRIGYAGGPQALIKNMAKIQSQSTTNPSSISQYAALEALKNSQDFIATQAHSFEKRRDLVLNKLRNINGITCNKPEGAFYLFPSCEEFIGKKMPNGNIIKDDLDFANYLLNDALIAVVPGSPFGMKNFFRISYAAADEVLEKACIRISDSLSKLRF